MSKLLAYSYRNLCRTFGLRRRNAELIVHIFDLGGYRITKSRAMNLLSSDDTVTQTEIYHFTRGILEYMNELPEEQRIINFKERKMNEIYEFYLQKNVPICCVRYQIFKARKLARKTNSVILPNTASLLKYFPREAMELAISLMAESCQIIVYNDFRA